MRLICFSVDESNGRTLKCSFEFKANEDVTEKVETIFANFDDTNNKFAKVDIDFGTNKRPENFSFNSKSTGRLEMESLKVGYFCTTDEHSPVMFSDTALVNSQISLAEIEIWQNTCPGYQTFYFAENFLADLVKLRYINLQYYNYDAQKFPEASLENLESLGFSYPKMSNMTPNMFPVMSKLYYLRLNNLEVTELPAGLIENFPALKLFVSSWGNIEVIPSGFFHNMSSSQFIDLSVNKITSVDLTGLNSNTYVSLDRNNITQLAEANFRPYVEGILNNMNATGYISIKSNPLECSCDVKWLVYDLDATFVFQDAVCANGTALQDINPIEIMEQCPDY